MCIQFFQHYMPSEIVKSLEEIRNSAFLNRTMEIYLPKECKKTNTNAWKRTVMNYPQENSK